VPFLQVVDPSQMEVRVEVNQMDFRNVHLGQKGRDASGCVSGVGAADDAGTAFAAGAQGQFNEIGADVCDAICCARAGRAIVARFVCRRWIWIWEARVRNWWCRGRALRAEEKKMFCVGERREFV